LTSNYFLSSEIKKLSCRAVKRCYLATLHPADFTRDLTLKL